MSVPGRRGGRMGIRGIVRCRVPCAEGSPHSRWNGASVASTDGVDKRWPCRSLWRRLAAEWRRVETEMRAAGLWGCRLTTRAVSEHVVRRLLVRGGGGCGSEPYCGERTCGDRCVVTAGGVPCVVASGYRKTLAFLYPREEVWGTGSRTVRERGYRDTEAPASMGGVSSLPQSDSKCGPRAKPPAGASGGSRGGWR